MLLENFFPIFKSGISLVILEIILFFILIKYWKFIYLKFFNINLQINIQAIHSDITPRLGGVIIYFCFCLSYLLDKNYLIFKFSLTLFPLIFLSLFEDLYQNIKPSYRLINSILTSFIFLIYFNEPFPNIEIPYLDIIFNNYYFMLIFLALCISGITNGMNILDGSNGSASFTAISILICLFYFFSKNNNFIFSNVIILIIIFLSIFILFNFPVGKIFLGDAGAYFLGFILACLTIILFHSYPKYPSWGAILILFYPAIEVIFSYSRKILTNKNPFKPDRQHLHLLIYDYLIKKGFSKHKSNNLVAIILLPIYSIGPIVFAFFYNSINYVMLSIIFLIFLYISIYFFFNKK